MVAVSGLAVRVWPTARVPEMVGADTPENVVEAHAVAEPPSRSADVNAAIPSLKYLIANLPVGDLAQSTGPGQPPDLSFEYAEQVLQPNHPARTFVVRVHTGAPPRGIPRHRAGFGIAVPTGIPLATSPTDNRLWGQPLVVVPRFIASLFLIGVPLAGAAIAAIASPCDQPSAVHAPEIHDCLSTHPEPAVREPSTARIVPRFRTGEAGKTPERSGVPAVLP